MAELTMEEMSMQTVAVLPERAALGVYSLKVKVNAYNNAESSTYLSAFTKSNVAAVQTIVIGG